MVQRSAFLRDAAGERSNKITAKAQRLGSVSCRRPERDTSGSHHLVETVSKRTRLGGMATAVWLQASRPN
jgi:hypothetical protein